MNSFLSRDLLRCSRSRVLNTRAAAFKLRLTREQLRKSESGNQDGDDFFQRFSSIKVKYENSVRRTIKQFRGSLIPDEAATEELWSLGVGGLKGNNELYAEVLYTLVHAMKTRSKDEFESVLAHLQKVFQFDKDKHQKHLTEALAKKAPPLVLNLEIVEAKGLTAKDVNGLSDPYCTLGVSAKMKLNTTTISKTLTPVWREFFSIALAINKAQVLTIEVWDYDDPEETLTSKVKSLNDVKSTSAVGMLMKEIALFKKQKTDDFLGGLKIPTKTIPPEGFDKWFSLEDRNGRDNKKNGEIHLRMVVGAEKKKGVAFQEYSNVLQLCVDHEVPKSTEEGGKGVWDGQLSENSKDILKTLRWNSGLLPPQIDLAKWLVYTHIQCDIINARLFSPIFIVILEFHKDAFREEDMRKFWLATEKLVVGFSSFLGNIHTRFLTDRASITTQAYHMLRTLGHLRDFLAKTPKGENDGGINLTPEKIIQTAKDAICRGAKNLYNNVLQSEIGENQVETIVKTGQLLVVDLKKILESLQKFCIDLLGINYFEMTYRIYDEMFCAIVTPVVTSIADDLQPIVVDTERGCAVDDDFAIGTSLFELYLAVKQFADLSAHLTSKKGLSIDGHFHKWFYSSVTHWLDMAWCKAMQRIKKAVELDKCKPEGTSENYTSSAIDTVLVFHQIQVTWNQLSWPDVEGSLTFIFKILNDFCKCIIYYAELISSKVEDIPRQPGVPYQISDHLCYAINNIRFMEQGMTQIIEKLSTEPHLIELGMSLGPDLEAEYRSTLTRVMDKINRNVLAKKDQIIGKAMREMKPVISDLLTKALEAPKEDEHLRNLREYFDGNLYRLKEILNPEEFDLLFGTIWETTLGVFKEIVLLNIEKHRPPAFFQKIQNIFELISNFFFPDGIDEGDSGFGGNVDEVQNLINLYGAPTADLLLQFAKVRLQQQDRYLLDRYSEHGLITFRVAYCEAEAMLKVEILNCRGLQAHDSNGLCDPYVKLKMIPRSAYPSFPKKKTKVIKKELFPLFDENFSIPLKAEDVARGGILHLMVKDYDFIGKNEFVGEAFVALQSIETVRPNVKFQELPQINLPLSAPNEELSRLLQALEIRTGDQEALKFARKERVKEGSKVKKP